METSCISNQAEAYTYYVPRPMKTGKSLKVRKGGFPSRPEADSSSNQLLPLLHNSSTASGDMNDARSSSPQCHPVVSYDLVKISSPASVFARPIVIRIMRSFNTSDSVATGPAAIQIGAFVRLIVRADHSAPRHTPRHLLQFLPAE